MAICISLQMLMNVQLKMEGVIIIVQTQLDHLVVLAMRDMILASMA